MINRYYHYLGAISVVWLSFFLLPLRSAAQDLTEAQRQERCQNNKSRLKELEAQLSELNGQLSQIMTAKEMEHLRDQLAYIKKAKTDFNQSHKLPADQKRMEKIAAEYKFDMVDCIETDIHDEMVCMTDLEKLIVSKIEKNKAVNKQELIAKKNKIQNDIAFHKNNLVALGCNSPGINQNLTGTWKCNDGGTYVITQSGQSISWEAASADQGKTFSHSFTGTITGNIIKGHFQDHPPGNVRQNGDLEFRIVSKNELVREKASVPFGCSQMHKEK